MELPQDQLRTRLLPPAVYLSRPRVASTAFHYVDCQKDNEFWRSIVAISLSVLGLLYIGLHYCEEKESK